VAELVPGVIQRGYFGVTAPLVRLLLRSGITPNALTTVGAVLTVVSAVAYGVGWMHWGGIFLLSSGIVDTLDGQVARQGAHTTKFGAFYDSTLDRVGDGVTFIGIAAYLTYADGVHLRELSVIACMVAIVAALLVSYMRARAEGLGLTCNVGIFQRAERILLLGIPTTLIGGGKNGVVITVLVIILTTLSLITVVQRFVHVRHEATLADLQSKGTQRG
jgi:CDP-diacylglycerol--glycerol-3-phosphate 3-phosphatidyltransferase